MAHASDSSFSRFQFILFLTEFYRGIYRLRAHINKDGAVTQ